MPTIPAPKEQSVMPEGALPYQSVNTSPTTFGAGLAQGMDQAANSQFQMLQENQQIKNEADRVSAENELMSRAQDLQNGNKAKGIVGYRTLIGQNAVNALPDYQKQLTDAYQDVRSNLNPAVQRMFDATAFRVVRGSMDSMGAYSSQQQVVGMHQDARSRVDLARQGALTYADEPGGWDAHLSDLQEASMRSSQILGLTPDATEEQRRRDVSQAYIERTKQLVLRNPIQAADFYHQNIGAVSPDQRFELERMLKTTTDGQYARTDGTEAYHSAIGQPTAPALPANKNAPDLKPFDQTRLDQISKFVKGSTPWDGTIAAAAKQYNVNPNEIKLKIAIESGGDPKIVNPQSGTTGLGQFTADTAKRYGITDRTDPVQSINGIAKMLAANGGTVGGDLSGADRAYYGGSPNARGPNTDQYVENTRAARQAVMGGGAPAPLTTAQLEGKEGDVLAQAQAYAEQRRPGDPVYRDQVVSEARGNWAKDVQALRGQDQANMSKVLDAVVHSKFTQFGDLPPELQTVVAKLTPQDYRSIQTQFERNVREANGEFTHSDPKLVNDLRQRLYLPDGDPNKITSPDQLTPFIAHGVNYTDHQRLLTEMKEANNPETNPFLKQVNGIKATARNMLKTNMSPLTLAHPDMAEEGAYRFGVDLDQKIKAARAAKTDPTTLFTPGSKDYVLDPARVASFMPTQPQIVASQANKTPITPVAGAPVAKRLPGESPAAYLARTAAK